MDTRPRNSDSVVNTLLIIVVLLVIAGFIAWWFGMYNATTEQVTPDNSTTIDTSIDIPTTPTDVDTNPAPSAP